MRTSAEFWDNISHKYAKKAVPSQDIYEEKLSRTQKLFNKDSIVMEFGCGTGTTALIHSPFVKEIVAYDYSAGMIDIANQKKNEKQLSNVTFEVKAVEDIPFHTNTYDVIMAHSVLHLTKNNEQILKKAYDALKPGGHMVSSSGCIKEMNIFIRGLIPLLASVGKAPEITTFTANEMIELHKQTGFKIYDAWSYKKGELFLIAQK
ncbi:class I SAM-dependent methyltransferase [Bacteriovorax sp. Seq25_V]|uniref:class I SAM-dependent methyltransferase n=1 Tax=Bacteriovorax sp. Seq25_V TaxID=1201288 RepID=UPI00038A1A32|nr:class I SAM-dependent methyltransferase [Bacteriovorax sp. Seq25_V]EQC47536.1 ribosomal protein L11 methyltransferase-like protein [Bacteriovorax sp. Seq25_V]